MDQKKKSFKKPYIYQASINMVFQIYECRSVDQETMTMYGYSRNDPE